MKHRGSFEETNFKTLIEQDGTDRLDDRLNIINTFLATEEHLTIDALTHLLEEKGYHYELDFVKQCMNRMVELGFAHRTQFEGQAIRYEHRHLGIHHDHLICTKCGKIVEFSDEDMERLQVKMASLHGFHMLQHRMEIYGLCDECLAQRRALMPLTLARAGEQVVIREISGGREAKARLAAMGLRSGDQIEVISNNGGGRLIVGRDYMRMGVGRGIAEKVMVGPAEEDNIKNPH